MKRIITIFLFLLLGIASAQAQNSTQGKEFWISFMQNGYKYYNGFWVETQVMISAKQACSGTITNPRTSWSMPFAVDDESVVVLSIPEDQGYNENNEGIPSDFGLLLTATDTVSVFIANCATNSFDASFVLPTESLGSDYIIQQDIQSKSKTGTYQLQETSAFLIVAAEDNTMIDIIPSVTTIDGHTAATSYTISLDRGQTYSMRSNYDTPQRDLSGTIINARANKKIAVFNGNTLTNIPGNEESGHDHIFEQALPVKTWGQNFAITGSFSRTRDQVRVTAGNDNDTVWCNGAYQTTLEKGQSFTFWLYSSTSGNQPFGGGSCFVETSQPSQVYMYNTTGGDSVAPSEENGDPSMVWIPPVEQKIDKITFCTFSHTQAPISNHYVNVVVENESVNEVYLDGNLLDAGLFIPLRGNESYSYAQLEITHDVHHLSCQWGLIAHVYGFGYHKGYAYCVGANVLNLTGTLLVNGQLGDFYQGGLELCIGDEANFEVRTNYPVQSVVWDFDGTLEPGGITASHIYNQSGDFITKAIVEGHNTYTNESFYDTLTMMVHVNVAGYTDLTYVLCDEDSIELNGQVYTESGCYEYRVPNAYGCDSLYRYMVDLNFTPYFSIQGDHWPIGGSETHISINEYAIRLDDARTTVDTVIWQIDCENWRLVPHGVGKTCTLYIYSYLEEPVMLHAIVVNRCGTEMRDFTIKTTYFDVDENEAETSFSISPNPTNGHLTLHLDSLEGLAEFNVYSSSGRWIESFAVDADVTTVYDYTLPDLGDGIYFLVLRNNGSTIVKKFSVVR